MWGIIVSFCFLALGLAILVEGWVSVFLGNNFCFIFDLFVDFLNPISEVFIKSSFPSILVNSFHCLGPVGFIFGGWQWALLLGWVFSGVVLGYSSWCLGLGNVGHVLFCGFVILVGGGILLWGWPSFSFGVSLYYLASPWLSFFFGGLVVGVGICCFWGWLYGSQQPHCSQGLQE